MSADGYRKKIVDQFPLLSEKEHNPNKFYEICQATFTNQIAILRKLAEFKRNYDASSLKRVDEIACHDFKQACMKIIAREIRLFNDNEAILRALNNHFPGRIRKNIWKQLIVQRNEKYKQASPIFPLALEQLNDWLSLYPVE